MTVLPSRRARTRVAARAAERRAPWHGAFVLLALLLLLAVLLPAKSQAQEEFPRIGLSAAKDAYVDAVSVPYDTDFEIYAMVFGHNPGEAINQPVSSLPWVIHQVCCGAVLEINDIMFNPELEHSGHPLAGMVTSSDVCVDQDSIWLATLTVRMVSQEAGEYLWAAGPFGPIADCDGTAPFFMSMPVTITLDQEPTPNEDSSWGHVKAMYR